MARVRDVLPEDHPLHNERFRKWVYDNAVKTDAKTMADDLGFVCAITKVLGGDKPEWDRTRTSSWVDDDAPGGIRLLDKEYREELAKDGK